jgi:hypothetical protein
MNFNLTQDDLDRANAVRERQGWSLLTWDQAESALDYWQPNLISMHMFLVRLIAEVRFGEKRIVK